MADRHVHELRVRFVLERFDQPFGRHPPAPDRFNDPRDRGVGGGIRAGVAASEIDAEIVR